jgi:hypothetical protein
MSEVLSGFFQGMNRSCWCLLAILIDASRSENPDLDRELLERIQQAVSDAGLWDELTTDWLMPGLRIDAVVGQGAGASAAAVRNDWRSGSCRTRASNWCAHSCIRAAARGQEYLRIIYGPEYTASENLERLRARGLGTKRSLALREFALGIEGLQRFVESEPLRRVHECVFGVLVLEGEPVDPRL